MKRSLFKLAALLVSVALTAIGVEVLANVHLYVRDGRYVSARERLDALGNTFIADVTRQNSGCRYILTPFSSATICRRSGARSYCSTVAMGDGTSRSN